MSRELPSSLRPPPKFFRSLDKEGLHDLMRELFAREGELLGLPASQIHVSDNLDSGDEGCDGSTPHHDAPRTDWIPKVETCWQFKSGKAGQPSKLRGEVRKSIPRRVLKAGGAYIVVASYASGKKAIDDRLAVLRREARRSRLPTDRIYVYTCEQLADWCASHAALASRYLGLPAETLLIENWENNQQFTLAFHQTGSVTKQLDEIRAGLGFAMGKLQHLHIAGPPGVGKTRRLRRK